MVDANQLMESMKVCDKFRSRSSLDLGLSVIHTHFSCERSLPLGYLFVCFVFGVEFFSCLRLVYVFIF